MLLLREGSEGFGNEPDATIAIRATSDVIELFEENRYSVLTERWQEVNVQSLAVVAELAPGFQAPDKLTKCLTALFGFRKQPQNIHRHVVERNTWGLIL